MNHYEVYLDEAAVLLDGGGPDAVTLREVGARAVVGEQKAQRYAAVLLTGAHGAAGLEFSGLLHTDKWQTSAEELIDNLLATLAETEHGRR